MGRFAADILSRAHVESLLCVRLLNVTVSPGPFELNRRCATHANKHTRTQHTLTSAHTHTHTHTHACAHTHTHTHPSYIETRCVSNGLLASDTTLLVALYASTHASLVLKIHKLQT